MRKLQILFKKINKYSKFGFDIHSVANCRSEDIEKISPEKKRMAEFGFFVLGAVIGVPAALGGLGAYVRPRSASVMGKSSFLPCLDRLHLHPQHRHHDLSQHRPIPCPCHVPGTQRKICKSKVTIATTTTNITNTKTITKTTTTTTTDIKITVLIVTDCCQGVRQGCVAALPLQGEERVPVDHQRGGRRLLHLQEAGRQDQERRLVPDKLMDWRENLCFVLCH